MSCLIHLRVAQNGLGVVRCGENGWNRLTWIKYRIKRVPVLERWVSLQFDWITALFNFRFTQFCGWPANHSRPFQNESKIEWTFWCSENWNVLKNAATLCTVGGFGKAGIFIEVQNQILLWFQPLDPLLTLKLITLRYLLYAAYYVTAFLLL